MTVTHSTFVSLNKSVPFLLKQHFEVTKSPSAKDRWTGGFISVLQCETQAERSSSGTSSVCRSHSFPCHRAARVLLLRVQPSPSPIQRRHLWLFLQVLSHCGSEPIFKAVCGGRFWRDKDKPMPFARRCRLGMLMTLDSVSICILHYENRRSAGRANVAFESSSDSTQESDNRVKHQQVSSSFNGGTVFIIALLYLTYLCELCGPFCVELACHPCVCVGSIQALRLPPTPQKHAREVNRRL